MFNIFSRWQSLKNVLKVIGEISPFPSFFEGGLSAPKLDHCGRKEEKEEEEEEEEEVVEEEEEAI